VISAATLEHEIEAVRHQSESSMCDLQRSHSGDPSADLLSS